MKKFFPLFIFLLVLYAFPACTPDNPRGSGTDNPFFIVGYTISAEVENGSYFEDVIDSVKIMEYDETYRNYQTIAAAKYQNGGFVLGLPAVLPDSYLSLLAKGAPEYITFSDPNTKIYSENEIYAYNKVGYRIATFFHIGTDATQTEMYEALYWYADRNCTFTGSVYNKETRSSATFDVHLVAGWNIVYAGGNEKEGTMQATTTKPYGITFKWYFGGSNYYAPLKKSHFLW